MVLITIKIETETLYIIFFSLILNTNSEEEFNVVRSILLI